MIFWLPRIKSTGRLRFEDTRLGKAQVINILFFAYLGLTVIGFGLVANGKKLGWLVVAAAALCFYFFVNLLKNGA
jgi:hypothetical protein